MCQVHDIYGFRRAAFGAMAEYVLLPANALNYKVPDAVPIEHAAYIEPLACAIHAVQHAQIELDHTVAIAGCGPLGLGMVATARLKTRACSSPSTSTTGVSKSPGPAAPTCVSTPARSMPSPQSTSSPTATAAMSTSRPPATPPPSSRAYT